MPGYFDTIEIKISPRCEEGMSEVDKRSLRLRTALEYCGAVFRGIGNMRVALRSNSEDPQPANLHEWLLDFDDELFVLARLGDAIAGAADHEFYQLIELIDGASPSA